MSATDLADTAWGRVCASIHALVAADWPSLSVGIGLVGSDGSEAVAPTPQHVLFTRPPKVKSRIAAGLRGTPFDRCILTRADFWMHSPAECESVWTSFLLALNQVAHGRAGIPVDEDIDSGDTGSAASRIGGTFILRVGVSPPPYANTIPTSHGLTAAATEGNPPDEAILVP